jgi:hypothetical protein
MRLALLSVLLFLSPAWAEPSPEVLRELRQGGYVLYLRHTSTDFSQNDSRMTSFEDCASQRNLTDRGRDEARAIGEHMTRLKIPIGEVSREPVLSDHGDCATCLRQGYGDQGCARRPGKR